MIAGLDFGGIVSGWPVRKARVPLRLLLPLLLRIFIAVGCRNRELGQAHSNDVLRSLFVPTRKKSELNHEK